MRISFVNSNRTTIGRRCCEKKFEKPTDVELGYDGRGDSVRTLSR